MTNSLHAHGQKLPRLHADEGLPAFGILIFAILLIGIIVTGVGLMEQTHSLPGP